MKNAPDIFIGLEVPFQSSLLGNEVQIKGWLEVSSSIPLDPEDILLSIERQITTQSSKLNEHQDGLFFEQKPGEIFENLVLERLDILPLDNSKNRFSINGVLKLVDNQRSNGNVLRLKASYQGCENAYSHCGTFSFVAISEPLLGGPIQKLPNILRDDCLVMDFWALNQTEDIINARVTLGDNLKDDPKVIVKTGIKSHRFYSNWPDAKNSTALGGQLRIDFPNNEENYSVNVKLKQHEIFFGNIKKIGLKEVEREINSVSLEDGNIVIKGLLFTTIPTDINLFLCTSRNSYKCGENLGTLEWYSNPEDLISFGSLAWKTNNRFCITFPISDLPNYPGSFSLYYLISNILYKFDQREIDFLNYKINSLLKNILDSKATFGKQFFRKLSIKGLLPISTPKIPAKENESTPIGCLFGFHNLALTEGAPVVLKNIITGLSDRIENGIHAICLNDGEMRKDILQSNIPLASFFEGSLIGMDSTKYESAFAMGVELFRQINPKVLVANCIDSFILVDIAWRLKIPVIWIIHESVDPETWYYSYDLWIRQRFFKALKMADQVVFVSERTSQLYSEFVKPNQCKIIKNGLDIENFQKLFNLDSKSTLRSEFCIPDSDIVFLSVGTTTERKGQDRTLRELSALKAKNPGLKWKFLIVGAREIPYLSSIRSLVNELNLQDEVLIIPETRDVHKFYSMADVFILNSKEESSPLVILEAFCAKLPVFSTDVYGLSEILINEDNSIIFNGELEGDLANKINTYLDNVTMLNKITEQAFKQVKERYSLANCLVQYQALINKFNC